MTENELNEFFHRHNISATVNHYTALKRTIYYAAIGEDYLPAILFIHGSPASMIIYKNYFADEELLKQFSLYAVDRAGFGVTDGKPEPSIKKQAEMVVPLAERIHRVHQPLIIVADSYGASIACRLVMEHPQIVQSLVLISPLLAPGLERMFWMTSLLHNTFLNKFISKEYQSATEEKIYQKKELSKMIPLWNKIDIPVYYLQSENDRLLYSSNADFAKKHLVNCPTLQFYFFKGRTKDVHSKQHQLIRNKILEMYQKILNS